MFPGKGVCWIALIRNKTPNIFEDLAVRTSVDMMSRGHISLTHLYHRHWIWELLLYYRGVSCVAIMDVIFFIVHNRV
jgi:hypothetical protein